MTKDEVIATIQSMARNGEAPTMKQWSEAGHPQSYKQFGGWTQAVQAAGFQTNAPTRAPKRTPRRKGTGSTDFAAMCRNTEHAMRSVASEIEACENRIAALNDERIRLGKALAALRGGEAL